MIVAILLSQEKNAILRMYSYIIIVNLHIIVCWLIDFWNAMISIVAGMIYVFYR